MNIIFGYKHECIQTQILVDHFKKMYIYLLK